MPRFPLDKGMVSAILFQAGCRKRPGGCCGNRVKQGGFAMNPVNMIVFSVAAPPEGNNRK